MPANSEDFQSVWTRVPVIPSVNLVNLVCPGYPSSFCLDVSGLLSIICPTWTPTGCTVDLEREKKIFNQYNDYKILSDEISVLVPHSLLKYS